MKATVCRREFLIGGVSLAAVAALPALAIAASPVDHAAAHMWKLRFAAEFGRHVDMASAPNPLAILSWITSEADGAFDGLTNPLATDPVEEAREAVYAIGACS